jgi:hypothetical protein
MFSIPVIGVIIFLTILSGAGPGVLLGRLLPAHHLSDQSKSVITVATAIVGTASALVLGLLISTASSAFTQRSGEVRRIAVDIIRLDSLLRNYGPEAKKKLAPSTGRPPPIGVGRPALTTEQSEIGAAALDLMGRDRAWCDISGKRMDGSNVTR